MIRDEPRRDATSRWRPLLFAAVLIVGVIVLRQGRAGGQDARTEALAAADEFFDRYLQPSGRIARTDQGGDTVSEGQAYGLLLAAATGDEERFRRVWAWTDEHLQRSDRLLAWRWANGGVADWSPATDADLIAAGALALAGERFADPTLAAESARIGAAVLGHETWSSGTGRVLLAGPWARVERVVNPSYFVVGMMSRLWWTTGDRRWGPVAATSRAMLGMLTAGAPHLPPDWSTLAADGTNPQPRASPGGASPRYGYEAARVFVQLAVDCRARGQAIAARAWPFLQGEADATIEAEYTLAGAPIGDTTHALALVAAASSAAAAGDTQDAARLLDAADAHDERHPTYYGAAWIALARLWLDTDLLGGCRPTHPTS